MGLEPQAAVTADWVIIRDGDAGKLLVFSRLGMIKRLETQDHRRRDRLRRRPASSSPAAAASASTAVPS